MTDVTEMLEQDHRKVEKLFEQIKASKGAAPRSTSTVS